MFQLCLKLKLKFAVIHKLSENHKSQTKKL